MVADGRPGMGSMFSASIVAWYVAADGALNSFEVVDISLALPDWRCRNGDRWRCLDGDRRLSVLLSSVDRREQNQRVNTSVQLMTMNELSNL